MSSEAGRKPAFPTTGPFEPGLSNSSYAYPGVTIRDFFAAHALAGMLALPSDAYSGNFHNNCGEPFIGTAEYAYRMADAMLKARHS